MKRIAFITLICFCVTVVFAQSSEVKKAIRKFDVAAITHDVTFNSPSSFWFAIRDNNKRVQDIDKAYQNENKSLKESLIYVNNNLDDSSKFPNLSSYDDSLDQWLNRKLGMNIVVRKKPIKFLYSEEFQASMDPIGQMYLCKGLIKTLTYEEILAVCAHEMAHYICAHALSETWKLAKKNKEKQKLGCNRSKPGSRSYGC